MLPARAARHRVAKPGGSRHVAVDAARAARPAAGTLRRTGKGAVR
jgi:hypothetical protein